MGQTDHAVVCGISTYPAFEPLQGPEHDAKEFKKWLLDEAKVPENHIRLVLSSEFASQNVAGQPLAQAKPSLDAVNAKFRELVDLARQNFHKLPRVGRRLYIYMSGHGLTPRSLNPEGAAALLMANASPEDPGFHLSGTAYAEWFRKAHAFDEILLFMDCCRNAFEDIDEAPVPFGQLEGGKPSVVKIFQALATQWDGPSFEQPIGSPPVQRSVFTYALLEAFKTVRDDKGRLRASELGGPIRTTITKLRKGDVPQFPKLMLGDLSQDIVLVEDRVAPLPRVTIEWDPRFFGTELLILDGFGKPLDPEVRVVPSGTAVPINLRPGLYQVVETPPRFETLRVSPGLTREQQGIGHVTVE